MVRKQNTRAFDAHVCMRCGWPWTSRLGRRPSGCPNCKSKYWDKPRRIIRKPAPKK